MRGLFAGHAEVIDAADEAAAEEVAKKRGFARALNLIADKAAVQWRRKNEAREQRELEALWRPAERSDLAS